MLLGLEWSWGFTCLGLWVKRRGPFHDVVKLTMSGLMETTIAHIRECERAGVGSAVKSTCCSCRPGWTSSTHITAIPNSSPRNPALFWLSWAPDTHGAQTNMQTKHSYIWGHIINIFSKRGNVRIERVHGHHPGWLLLYSCCYCTIRRR